MVELALIALLALGVSGGTDVARDAPTYSEEIFVVGDIALVEPVAEGQPVFLTFSVGELDIVASDSAELRAELVADCTRLTPERCARARKRLQIEPRRTEHGLEIRMIGVSKRLLRRMDIEGRVSLPADSPLVARIGIGDVDIQAGTENLIVNMGIGDLTIHAPESAIDTVSVNTGIGDASIRTSGRVKSQSKRKKLVGARAFWSSNRSGEDPSRVEARLRIGDAKVVLD